MDFVTYQITKKLKEKGFPVKGKEIIYGDNGVFVPMPTIAQVLKWLREEKKIHIAVDIMRPYPQSQITNWGYNIVLINKYEVYHFNWNLDSYDESVLDGIEYVLDNLI